MALKEIWEKFAVAIVFVVFVVFRAADRVLSKRVSNSLQNPTYNLILWNLIWPLAIQLVTLAYMFPYIAYQRARGASQYTWRFLLPGNSLASTMGAVPLYQFALFSIGDQVNVAIQAPASPFISQTMQSVMTNTTIIWTLAFSACALGTRYKQVHYIGCVMILISIVVGLSSQLSHDDCTPVGMAQSECLNSYKGDDGIFHQLDSGSMILWFGMFLLSILPGAASNVYKQFVLQGRDVDIIYATWWSGNFQVMWGLFCIPMLWIKLPGQDLSPGGTYQAILDTFSCLCGNVPNPGDESCQGSPTPLLVFAIYLFFNMSFNILMLWLTKHMSATWAQIATVLCLDLTNIFGMFPILAGSGAQSMSLDDWLATAIASMALWTYNLETETRPGPKECGEGKLPTTPCGEDDSDYEEGLTDEATE